MQRVPQEWGVPVMEPSSPDWTPDFRIYDEVMMTSSANTRSNPPSEARFFALIPCAGQGSRAVLRQTEAPAALQPKQYQVIAGEPMVSHTLAAFASVPRIARTLVVVAPGDHFFAQRPAATVAVADCGGASRAATVRNGLEALLQGGAEAHDWVLVHDAARCLIAPAQIDQLIDACAHDDVGGLLAHKLPDTLKREADGRVAATLDRSDKWLAQTPQMFRIGLLMQALDASIKTGTAVTDESSAIEALGLAPRLVPGGAHNFKVTYPEDFALAEAVLLNRRGQG